MSKIIKKKEELFDANNNSLGEQKMSRIITEYVELVDAAGNSIGEGLRAMYFKTDLDTEVMIDTSLYTIIFTPEEEDFFTQETLDAICRVLKEDSVPFTEEDGRIFANFYEGDFETIINNIVQQVDTKLDEILEEKGIDPNSKNDDFLNLYSDSDGFGYDLYEDIRSMYEREDSLPYDESKYTEPVGNIDNTDFTENIEIKKTVNWFGFIK